MSVRDRNLGEPGARVIWAARKVGRMLVAKTQILTGWRQETDSTSSKPPTAPHCPAGVFLVEIRLANAPKVYFFRACGGPKSVFFSFMLVYRTPLDKHKTLKVDPL